MARLIRRSLAALLLLALSGLAYLAVAEYARRFPQDVPWTDLRLDQPVGRFTLGKVVGLADDPARCRALLLEAGSDALPVRPLRSGTQCGYENGMRLRGDLDFVPAQPVTSCPMAAALELLAREVLQPAAIRHFGSPVATIDHAGSYSCRRLYGRADGPYSEHASANAFDILGFRLADGTRVSVVRDWQSNGPRGAFLHDVRDGSCKLFATVLSPDYNAAHADHLHLDLAKRGRSGWSLCR